MKIYILSKDNLKTKGVQVPISYEINEDTAAPVASNIKFVQRQEAVVGDYLCLKDRNRIMYQGILSGIDADKSSNVTTASCNPLSNIFSRNILLGEAASSVEQYIIDAINDNFVASGDAFLDIPYIDPTVATNTLLDITPHNDKGIYNLDTFLRYVSKRYDIFTDFNLHQGRLEVTIEKRIPQTHFVDATVADVINLNETVSSECTSKVIVKTLNSILIYYLFDDGTYGLNPVAGSRVKGNIMAIYCENPEDADKAAGDEFAKNQFNHLIELEILSDSRLYDVSDMQLYDKAKVKTKTGIYDTYISGRSFKSSTKSVLFKFGDVRVALTDKLRLGGQ